MGLLLCLFISLAFITNVPVYLSAEDFAIFEKDLDLQALPRPLTFEDEIRTIRIVQARVFAKAPYNEGIPGFGTREPADLLKYAKGLCYDRSRTLDKAFAYLGFKSRHVYLLYWEDRSFLGALVRYGHPSHAVTGVKTGRGWLFVDSNQEWIAVTRDGQAVGADDVWKRINEFDATPAYLKSPWWAIRVCIPEEGNFADPSYLSQN